MRSQKNETCWKHFLSLCNKTKNEQALDALFRLFLSDEEQSAVALRYGVVSALLKGEQSQREIAVSLNTSIAKITRGSNCLKQIDDSLKAFILQLETTR